MDAPAPALAGLRILDFSRFLPGAYVSWVLADMGAEVIRIEHPRELAKERAVMDAGGEDDAAYQLRRARQSWIRGKRSLMVNPGHPDGRALVHRLAAGVDVVVEDYRPGVLAGMGHGYADLAAINPRLVYTSVSFAGQTGPLAGRAGHDPAALALAGALSRLNGLAAPSLPGLQVADVLAGAHATIATLVALRARDTSGRGTHVDVAMSEAAMPLLMVTLARDPEGAAEGSRETPWHPKGGVWECADGGWICTTDMEPRYWARFCGAVGRPAYAALQHATDRHPAIAEDLSALFRTRPRDEWMALLAAADTQAMAVLSPAEAMAHPHAQARGMAPVVAVAGEAVTQLGTPFHLSGLPPMPPRPAGLPGEDNEAILGELGIDPAEQARLAEAGAFAP